MTQSQLALRVSAARQVEELRATPCGGLFPLTPALSLGARVKPSLRGEQPRLLDFPLGDARCSLSLGERVRVRGNGANQLADRTVPGTVELDESCGRAGGFLKSLRKHYSPSRCRLWRCCRTPWRRKERTRRHARFH